MTKVGLSQILIKRINFWDKKMLDVFLLEDDIRLVLSQPLPASPKLPFFLTFLQMVPNPLSAFVGIPPLPSGTTEKRRPQLTWKPPEGSCQKPRAVDRLRSPSPAGISPAGSAGRVERTDSSQLQPFMSCLGNQIEQYHPKN